MKTFEDLGLTFEFDSDCATCYDGSCHNTAISKIDGKEYSVHISTNSERDSFRIFACQNANTDEESIEEEFTDEEVAVNFVCKNFNGFKCF